jgi:hypothetical protein
MDHSSGRGDGIKEAEKKKLREVREKKCQPKAKIR